MGTAPQSFLAMREFQWSSFLVVVSDAKQGSARDQPAKGL